VPHSFASFANEWDVTATYDQHHSQWQSPVLILYFVTRGLERWYGGHDLHFITCSCYHRQPQLGSAYRRDLFLLLLEEVRQQLQFVVYGYVVMPEHFHLLISEPEKGDPSLVMKVVKQRFARLVNQQMRKSSAVQTVLSDVALTPVWQKRFYDFNVSSRRKPHREAALHASESREARVGGRTRSVEMEHLPLLRLR
jgi:REP element-mobilizing transposase RayT